MKKLPQLKNEGLLNWLEFINSKDKEARMLYKSRLKAWRDEQYRLEDAEKRFR